MFHLGMIFPPDILVSKWTRSLDRTYITKENSPLILRKDPNPNIGTDSAKPMHTTLAHTELEDDV